jgi:hypothetical protein
MKNKEEIKEAIALFTLVKVGDAIHARYAKCCADSLCWTLNPESKLDINSASRARRPRACAMSPIARRSIRDQTARGDSARFDHSSRPPFFRASRQPTL